MAWEKVNTMKIGVNKLDTQKPGNSCETGFLSAAVLRLILF